MAKCSLLGWYPNRSVEGPKRSSFRINVSREDPRRYRIAIIPVEKAKGNLKRKYGASIKRQGYVGTPPLLLSTRPELASVLGSFYAPEMETKRLLSMEVWQQIMIVVASANQCQYCATSHGYYSEVFLGTDKEKLVALFSGDWKAAGIDNRTAKLLEYARKLTLHPYAITDMDIQVLREAGYKDAEILEATVVICNCNAANRLVSALSGTPIPELAARYMI